MMTIVGSAVELERNREPLDDVGAVAGDRGFGDRLHRAVVGAGVVLGDPHDQTGDRQAGDAAEEQRRAAIGLSRHRAEADQPPRHQRDADQRQEAGRDQSFVERAHDRLARAELDEERPGDRRQDADAADGQRVGHHREQHVGARGAEEDRRQHHGGDGGHRVGLEQVGRHAGAVADVVADVVRDGGRVARIVLRECRPRPCRRGRRRRRHPW